MFNMIKKDCSFTTEEGYEFGFAQNSIANPRTVYFEIKKGDKYKGTWMEENDYQYAKEYLQDMGRYEAFKDVTLTKDLKLKIEIAEKASPYVFENLIIGRSHFSFRDEKVVQGNIELSEAESKRRGTDNISLEEIYNKIMNVRCWRAVKEMGRDVCDEEINKELNREFIKEKSKELV